MQANYVQRLRITFSKIGPTRFIGNLDLARTIERSLIRASIPLAYTQGFNPRPRLQLADALPLGFTSECEIIDVWLLEQLQPDVVMARLIPVMAPGLVIRDVIQVELRNLAIQNLIEASCYQVRLLDPMDLATLEERVKQLLSVDTIIRQKRGKQYDLRPLIHSLHIEGDSEGNICLTMELSLSPGNTARPDEVLLALDLDPLAAQIHRTKFMFSAEN